MCLFKREKTVRRSKLLRVLLLLIMVAVAIFYLWPTPRMPFEQIYAKVDRTKVESLRNFRRSHPLKQISVDGINWDYLVCGTGTETIVFLHGMAGAYDIWWQQIDALKKQFHIISLTYPPVDRLEDLEKGLFAILDKEGVRKFYVVGTSLGGYFAQYLISRHPDRIHRAVLSNTFPPNDQIAKKNRIQGLLVPRLPEWLVMAIFRGNFEKSIYPTSGNDELTLAFLNEIGYGRMNKAQLVGRYYCVIEKFAPKSPPFPVLIIESDNDPLIDSTLRQQLKSTYPNAKTYTFAGAGHFPYLNRAQAYTKVLKDFFPVLSSNFSFLHHHPIRVIEAYCAAGLKEKRSNSGTIYRHVFKGKGARGCAARRRFTCTL